MDWDNYDNSDCPVSAVLHKNVSGISQQLGLDLRQFPLRMGHLLPAGTSRYYYKTHVSKQVIKPIILIIIYSKQRRFESMFRTPLNCCILIGFVSFIFLSSRIPEILVAAHRVLYNIFNGDINNGPLFCGVGLLPDGLHSRFAIPDDRRVRRGWNL